MLITVPFTIFKRWKKPKCPSTDERIKKMWLIYRRPWQLSWYRICLQCKKPRFDSWVWKIPWRKDRLHIPVFLGFLGKSHGKESTCSVGVLGSIRGLGRSPRGGHSKPFQNYCLENPHGQRSLVGYSPWVHKELDMTKRTCTV